MPFSTNDESQNARAATIQHAIALISEGLSLLRTLDGVSLVYPGLNETDTRQASFQGPTIENQMFYSSNNLREPSAQIPAAYSGYPVRQTDTQHAFTSGLSDAVYQEPAFNLPFMFANLLNQEQGSACVGQHHLCQSSTSRDIKNEPSGEAYVLETDSVRRPGDNGDQLDLSTGFFCERCLKNFSRKDTLTRHKKTVRACRQLPGPPLVN
ncbi:hypothetical protein EC973_003657 [Apophysomyces ossiformis]|uniref:C2H2-type domain-containing protein n=1 Tax=Apophysomyces ossiformis TaxID=679940 RepID=A0A8H7BL82_9FUNG|nr:hypothetical protein EC973_003657 [Apophysomyces ossiformis]